MWCFGNLVFLRYSREFPDGTERNKMTHQEGTENWFSTSVAVTYVAPGTTEGPADRGDAGRSLAPGPP